MGDDAFEASEMHDGARIVHRDKRIARGMAAIVAGPGLLTMVFAAYVAVVNDTSSKPLPAAALPFVVAAIAALGALLVMTGIAFGVLRTIVTERAVHVKYGLWGPDVPLENIASCRVVDYEWTQFGGWGIRRGKDGTWAYVPASGKVVELQYRDGGKTKRVLVGVANAEETARRIEEARARLADGGARVRVEAEAPPSVERALDADDETAETGETARNRAG